MRSNTPHSYVPFGVILTMPLSRPNMRDPGGLGTGIFPDHPKCLEGEEAEFQPFREQDSFSYNLDKPWGGFSGSSVLEDPKGTTHSGKCQCEVRLFR